jgi:hypothetical protein
MNGKQTMSSFKVLPIVFANSFLLTQSVHKEIQASVSYTVYFKFVMYLLLSLHVSAILSIGTGIPSVAYWASKVAD